MNSDGSISSMDLSLVAKRRWARSSSVLKRSQLNDLIIDHKERNLYPPHFIPRANSADFNRSRPTDANSCMIRERFDPHQVTEIIVLTSAEEKPVRSREAPPLASAPPVSFWEWEREREVRWFVSETYGPAGKDALFPLQFEFLSNVKKIFVDVNQRFTTLKKVE